jgi:prepilin-type processing-associated H-X9-DG protein
MPPRKRPPVWIWIVGGCGCLFFGGIILVVILFPVFVQARNKALQTTCLSNVKQMQLGIQMYAVDYDQMFPPADTWMNRIAAHSNIKEPTFHCPELSQYDTSAYGYAFDIRLGSKFVEMSMPETVIVLYDSSKRDRNATDPLASLPTVGRHQGKNAIGYLDGHVKLSSSPNGSSGP